jgi:hypothetical protein
LIVGSLDLVHRLAAAARQPEDPSIPQDLRDLVTFFLPDATNPVRTVST